MKLCILDGKRHSLGDCIEQAQFPRNFHAFFRHARHGEHPLELASGKHWDGAIGVEAGFHHLIALESGVGRQVVDQNPGQIFCHHTGQSVADPEPGLGEECVSAGAPV